MLKNATVKDVKELWFISLGLGVRNSSEEEQVRAWNNFVKTMKKSHLTIQQAYEFLYHVNEGLNNINK